MSQEVTSIEKNRLSHLALSLFLLLKVTSKQINCLALFDSAIIVKLTLTIKQQI